MVFFRNILRWKVLPVASTSFFPRTCLSKAISSKRSVLELSKSQLASLENELIALLDQQKLLDEYNELLEIDAVEKLNKETGLLHRILNSGVVKEIGGSETSHLRNNNTLNSPHSETCLLSVATETELPTSISSTQTDESSLRTPESAASSTVSSLSCVALDIVACKCGTKHKLTAPWNSRIALIVLIPVLQRNPFQTAPSSSLVCCPFRFNLCTELMTQDNSRRDKFLRLTVDCVEIVNMKFPAFDFNFDLFLVNQQDSTKFKVRHGKWADPQEKNFSWDAILYSELINP